jgi:homoserine kinase type II
MSVYTAVEADALEQFLRHYDVGAALALDGILDGVENTNYFLTTSAGRYVLTLFESLPAGELPFFMDLMAWVAAHGVPAPRPVAARDGATIGSLCGKPAAIVERLRGRSVERPSPAQCAALGALVGRLHRVVADFGATRESTRSARWRARIAARLVDRVDGPDLELMRQELALQETTPLAGLPAGVVHGDLFRDNVLFDGAALTGVIDFYLAAREAFVYDLAVVALDWCFRDGVCDPVLSHRLLAAYRAERAVSAAEIAAWPLALRAAGLRFWLSRLHDARYTKQGSIVKIKDPAECRTVILAARRDPGGLIDCWSP